MRFDDMIATVLERPSQRADQRIAQWRQLVDLLAQRRDGGLSEQSALAFDFLRRHRDEVPVMVREQTAAALSGLRIDPRLIALFAEDQPRVGGTLLRGARLDEAEWLALLPSLGPTGRATLRHRSDLPPAVGRALVAFGPSDFVIEGTVDENAAAIVAEAEAELPSPPAIEPPAEIDGSSQIRELVERIEAFQKHREDAGLEAVAPGPAEEFRWETGPEGVILWVDGAPRGPLVGQSIAAIAGGGHYGVDGQAAGAFHKRAPFRDARFAVAGEGAASGGWRISGVPYFDMSRGNFRGYRGTARRPRFDEVAPTVADEQIEGLFGTNFAPDSLRQLIHELRTPLNAIIGFAELIEGQYMGPAGGSYRGRAAGIVSQAQRLLGAVDDLDTAARIETSRLELEPGLLDSAYLLTHLHQTYERDGDDGAARLSLRITPELPLATIEANAAERMVSRLLAATLGLARPGETIAAELRSAPAGARAIELALDRPAAIRGLEETQLLHPGYTPEGDWPGGPALGLGFALRLVRKLAEAGGGGLAILDAHFVLTMPAAGAPGVGRDEESA